MLKYSPIYCLSQSRINQGDVKNSTSVSWVLSGGGTGNGGCGLAYVGVEVGLVGCAMGGGCWPYIRQCIFLKGVTGLIISVEE